MPNYRRAFVPGACWFFTVNLLDLRRCLLTDNIDALREATRLTQTRHPFTIDAMMVLPDHIHAVWTLPPGDADFSLRWRLIKIDFAKAVPNTERRSAASRRMDAGTISLGAVLRDARKSALLRTRRMDYVDMIQTSESLH